MLAAKAALCLALLGVSAIAAAAQGLDETGPVATGTISVTPTKAGVEIEAQVAGHGKAAVTADLSLSKADASGSVTTRQSQEVAVTPGSETRVAKTRVSLGPEGTLRARLTLSRDHKIFFETEHSIDRRIFK